jgi:hypothetical protein
VKYFYICDGRGSSRLCKRRGPLSGNALGRAEKFYPRPADESKPVKPLTETERDKISLKMASDLCNGIETVTSINAPSGLYLFIREARND